MTDADLLRRAIAASGRSQVRFAREVLGVRDTTLRSWLAPRAAPSARPLHPTVRRVCLATLADPTVAEALAAADE